MSRTQKCREQWKPSCGFGELTVATWNGNSGIDGNASDVESVQCIVPQVATGEGFVSFSQMAFYLQLQRLSGLYIYINNGTQKRRAIHRHML